MKGMRTGTVEKFKNRLTQWPEKLLKRNVRQPQTKAASPTLLEEGGGGGT